MVEGNKMFLRALGIILVVPGRRFSEQVHVENISVVRPLSGHGCLLEASPSHTVVPLAFGVTQVDPSLPSLKAFLLSAETSASQNALVGVTRFTPFRATLLLWWEGTER